MSKINNFDVMKEMGERGMDSIKMAPLDNITGAKKNKHGWMIEIGCAFDPIPGIMNHQFVGGLILADKADFNRVKAEMAAKSALASGASLLTEARQALEAVNAQFGDVARNVNRGRQYREGVTISSDVREQVAAVVARLRESEGAGKV